MELPVISTESVPERADAARNRKLILAAAERLFADKGVSCTSMDAIAAEAGVGKGTLFRRFGDRATLAMAVLNETERELQDAIFKGPPPLGPGAEPVQRLIAFGDAVLDGMEQHTELSLEAERYGRDSLLRSEPYAVRWLHIRTLVSAARPDADAEYIADLLLAALSADLFVHQRHGRDIGLDRIKAGFADLVARLVG